MKKIWTVGLLFLLLAVCIKPVSAQSAVSGDFSYSLLPDDTVEITGYSGTETDLVIPNKLDGHVVTSIGEHAFYDKDLSSVQLPDSLIKIDDYAFMNCSGITNIELPESIEEIGGNPFGNCDIRFTVSPNHPYLAVSEGTLISRPDKRILYVPVNTESYIIPDDIAIIGNGAFYCCRNLTTIEIPDSVAGIDPYAFYNCSALTSVVIPDSVTTIGDYAFFGCTGIHELSIPDSVISMGDNPFCACDTTIAVSSDHPYLQIIDGGLLSRPDERLIYCPAGMESYSVPDGIKIIGKYAFYDCKKLANVNLPDSISEIGAYAFTGCDNLKISITQNAYAEEYCQNNNIDYVFKDTVDGADTAAAAASSQDKEETWECPECGNVSTDKFCNICGTKKPSTEWVCPNCGQTNNKNFCNNCGTAKPADGSMSTETEIEEQETRETIAEPADQGAETEEGIHRYEYVIEDCTWNQAFQKAKDRGGYLVHFDSREEYIFVLSEIVQNELDDIKFLIGARRDLSSRDYYWVDENNALYGDSLNSPGFWAFPEWMANEPSFKDGDTVEAYMDIFYFSEQKRWVWNDVPNDILAIAPYYSGSVGYIVEYDSMIS